MILDCYCDDRAIDHEALIRSLDLYGWLVDCVVEVAADDAGHGLEVGEVKHVTEPNDDDLGEDGVEQRAEADGSDLDGEGSFGWVVQAQRDRIVVRRTEALGRNRDDHLKSPARNLNLRPT